MVIVFLSFLAKFCWKNKLPLAWKTYKAFSVLGKRTSPVPDKLLVPWRRLGQATKSVAKKAKLRGLHSTEVAYLLLSQQPQVWFSAFLRLFSLDIAEIYLRHWLEQWTEAWFFLKHLFRYLTYRLWNNDWLFNEKCVHLINDRGLIMSIKPI